MRHSSKTIAASIAGIALTLAGGAAFAAVTLAGGQAFAGTVSDPIAVDAGGAGSFDSMARGAWDGSQYLVTWFHNDGSGDRHGDVSGRLVSAAGVPTSDTFFIARALLGSADVLWDGASFLYFCFAEASDGTVSWTMTRVSAAGVATGPFPLAPAGAFDAGAAAVSASGQVLSVLDHVPDDGLVRGQLLAPGATSGGPLFTIASSPPSLDHSFPTVASNGTDYLVTWTVRSPDSANGVFARAVTSAGAVAASATRLSNPVNCLLVNVRPPCTSRSAAGATSCTGPTTSPSVRARRSSTAPARC